MAGLPTVQVLLDNGTGTYPYDVTSYVRMVNGITVTRGRSDELSDVAPGTLTLTFDNTDGRFTYGSTTIASPSPIAVDGGIRVKVTANATTVNWFTGYVQEWPVSWPSGGDTFSTVTITATDALARAERRTLRALADEEILIDAPSGYYKLDDESGQTLAVDSSGNNAPSLKFIGTGAAPTFGNSVPSTFEDVSGVGFTGGQALGPVSAYASLPRGFEVVFSRSGTPGAFEGVLWNGSYTTGTDPTNSYNWVVWMIGTGQLQFGSSNLTTSSTYNDGLMHHVYLDTETFKLYVDGVLVGTDTGNATFASGAPITGTVARYATYSFGAQPNATRIAAHAAASVTGFAGESGTARITRLAGYGGITLGTLDTSLTNIAGQDTEGVSVADAIREVVKAEGGVGFVNGSGAFTFLNRMDVPEMTTYDRTFDANWFASDTTVTVDNQGLVNYMTVTATGTGVTQIVQNAASQTAHGRYSASDSYAVTTDHESLNYGNWLVATRSDPTPRAGSLTFDVLTLSAANQGAVLGTSPNDWYRITGLPSQTPGGTTADLIVQGSTEVISNDRWDITFNVTTRSPFYGPVWLLGDATYGVLGTTTKLYF